MKRIFSVVVMLIALGYRGDANAQAACGAAQKAANAVCAGYTACCSPVTAPCCAKAAACWGYNAVAFVSPVHLPFFDPWTMDLGGTISRGLQAVVKMFMSDGDTLVAELIYDGDGESGQGGGGGAGGNGGAYTGENGSAQLSLNALTSPIMDIPAEKGAYPEDIKVQQTSVDELAKYRIRSVVQEQASLDQLSADKWAIQYRAQQRAIQAMTDALVMKKAYKDLADIANKASSGSYSNYSEAASTVATRRLLLDELMALRKRVIAARIRARAETMEMDIDTVATAPAFEKSESASTNESKVQGTTENRAVGATADDVNREGGE